MALGFMATAFTLTIHILPPKVLFSRERIVGPTAQRQIPKNMLPTQRKGAQMVNFEAMFFDAARAAFIDVGTARPIPLVDRAAKPRRNIPSALFGF
jgi:hypothetical protein